MSKKIVHGLFADDDILMNAVKVIRQKGYEIDEIYTPFPVHGLDKAMGLKPTRIAYTAFMYGLLGLSVAITITWYMMIQDWPQDIGGKPSFTWFENMPAFVPIMFEMTVFFAAHLMVITYLIRNKMFPGKKGGSPDKRTTDDKFLMEFFAEGDTSDLEALLSETGAEEVSSKEVVEEKKTNTLWMNTIVAFFALFAMSSCSSDDVQREPNTVFMPNMYYSVGYETYAVDPNSADSLEARKPALGTIKRGYVPYEIPNTNEGYTEALNNLKSPIETTEESLAKGAELYNIYCISCHGEQGDGKGQLVLNDKILGVPSYAESRLPEITEGSIYHVITYGKNMMGSHASQLTWDERWKITQHVLKLRSQLK
jgi:mono/diheme cytochrome c family protein